MSDSNSPSPAGGDDLHAHDLRSVADGMDLSAFGFDEEGDDGERPGPPDGHGPGQAARQTGEQQDRARDDRGRFAAQYGDEARQEPGEGERQQDGEQGTDERRADQAEDGERQPGEGEPDKAEGKSLDFVELDGRRYSREDVQRGFLRQEDYSRKTGDLARDRQTLQGHAQRLQAHEQELGGILEIAVAALREAIPERPDVALIKTDLVAYQEQLALHEAGVARLQQLAGLHQQNSQQAQSQKRAAAERESAATTEHEKQQFSLLMEKIPSLRTDQGRDTFFREAGAYAERYGFTREEIGQGALNDHRNMLILQDAMLGHKVRTERSRTVERVKAAPPIRSSPRVDAGTRDGQARRTAQQRFDQNPSIQNALSTGVLDEVFADLS